MAQGQLPNLLQHLRRFAGTSGPSVPDAQLLERFVSRRDEAAFELLVWRHERMVLGICRSVLRREQDAEDAFQATFLALACRAGSIAKREAVASWLHKVAHRVARRQRANAANRSRNEDQIGLNRFGTRHPSDPCNEAAQRDLRHLLHEEVDRLPEKYRAPIVLCYLEGQTNEEAALQLQCPIGTVVTRLARGRQRLRSRLTRRGLGLSVGAVAATLAQSKFLDAAPAAFRDVTVRAAVQFATDFTAAGLVSPHVATLARGVLKAMVMTKTKFVAVIVLSLGLIGAGSGVLAHRPLPPRPAEERPGIVSQTTALGPDVDEAKDQPVAKDKKSTQRAADEADKQKDNDNTRTVREDVTKSFKTGKSPRVIVELYNGGIEVKATSETGVEARVQKQGHGKTEVAAKEALQTVDLKMTQDGEEVVIRASRSGEEHARNTGSSASADLTVPRGAVLELRTKNGQVAVNGGTGKVQVETSNGQIQVNDSKGPLDLKTSNGPITLKGVTGRVVAKTHNGKVTIQADKAVVTADTSNGVVQFQGSLAPGEHSLRTSNGSITMTLPADASFKVTAETSHGKIENDFSANKATVKSKSRLDNTVGQNPTAVIKLHTSNGSIAIQKENVK